MALWALPSVAVERERDRTGRDQAVTRWKELSEPGAQGKGDRWPGRAGWGQARWRPRTTVVWARSPCAKAHSPEFQSLCRHSRGSFLEDLNSGWEQRRSASWKETRGKSSVVCVLLFCCFALEGLWSVVAGSPVLFLLYLPLSVDSGVLPQ